MDTQNHNNSDDNNGGSAGAALNILSVVVSNVLLFFLIFGLSATVDVVNLRRQWRNKFAIGTGVAMQFLIMPVLGFVSVVALNDHGLTKAMGITLLVVTSSPGGSYSNWWCSTFNADLALSVTMTSISSLLSVAMLPANLFLYSYLAYGVVLNTDDNEEEGGAEENVVQALDFKAIFISLGVVMAAILSGLAAGYKWDYPAFHIYANRFGTVCGLLLIIFSVLLSFQGGENNDDNEEESSASFFNHSWAFYVGVALPCLVGIALANVLSRTCFRLSPPECVTLSIECCYQNVGIATSVAVTMYNDSPAERAQAIAVPLFYGIVEAVAIGIYCVWAWKAGWTKAPANEKICVVVSKTYEVQDQDHAEHETDDDFPLSSSSPTAAATAKETSSDPQTTTKVHNVSDEEKTSEDHTTSTCCTTDTVAGNSPSTTPAAASEDGLQIIQEGDGWRPDEFANYFEDEVSV